MHLRERSGLAKWIVVVQPLAADQDPRFIMIDRPNEPPTVVLDARFACYDRNRRAWSFTHERGSTNEVGRAEQLRAARRVDMPPRVHENSD